QSSTEADDLIARFRKFAQELADTFWLLPGLVVAALMMLAVGCVEFDRSGTVPSLLLDGPWLYNGGGTGARTLLGAVAASAIGVAGTVFSITIAALSLAAGQMGPRLLRNFVRDRGNQLTLGVLLGTFAYALMVLRSVRTQAEGEFIPHLSMSVGILLAFVCVGMLIYYVGHIAGRINVDSVIDLVAADVRVSLRQLWSVDQECVARHEPPAREGAASLVDTRDGYLLQLDEDGLADWASVNGACVQMLVRPGGYVFPGAPIAQVVPAVQGALEAVRSATALGSQRTTGADPEFAIRQLVEVALRALSPGINDPYTAINVIDRLGASLCELAGQSIFGGLYCREGRVTLIVPQVNYDGLVDAMFHMIRQSGRNSPAVLIRMLEVLATVRRCEPLDERHRTLRRHADIIMGDAGRSISTPEDLQDLRDRYDQFCRLERRTCERY
ncbi:MAG: DUF2254 domain-containing protein, partial [Pseudomonadota bacterium]